jgi:fluoride exporter
VTIGLFLGVVAAGALGAVARVWVSGAVQRRWPRRGAGTLAVNLSGAFALGLWLGLSAGSAAGIAVVGTGFLGAFTTFSTWMAEAAVSWREGRRGRVALSIGGTLAAGVAAALAGGYVGRLFA